MSSLCFRLQKIQHALFVYCLTSVFMNVKACCLVNRYKHFVGLCCLHLPALSSEEYCC